MHTQGGIDTRRCTQNAVCSHRRSLVIQWATGKAVRTQGGAHKMRSVATAGVSRKWAKLMVNKQLFSWDTARFSMSERPQ